VTEIDADDVARLRIALARIARVLDRQSRGHTLTGTQASVLATAARLGPVRITELAEIEGINPTMMSRIVGKLDDAGLLHRRADPDDRRAALVEPTTAGRELQRHVREERTRLLAEQLATLPAEDSDGLLDALPHLEALATALRTRSVLLFGPSSPDRWGPAIDPELHTVLWRGRAGHPGDPHGETVDPALAAIRVEEVLAAVDAQLRARDAVPAR